MKKLTLSLIFVSTLVGCKIFLAHDSWSWDQVKFISQMEAFASQCVLEGQLSTNLYQAFIKELEGWKAVSVFNEDHYSSNYVQSFRYFSAFSEEMKDEYCAEGRETLPATVEHIRERVASIRQARTTEAWAALAGGLGSLSTQARAVGEDASLRAMSLPPPQNTTTITPVGYQTIMINTPSGIVQRRCKELAGGNVYCF